MDSDVHARPGSTSDPAVAAGTARLDDRDCDQGRRPHAPPAGRPLPHPRRRDQPRLLLQLLRTPQLMLDELARDHGPVCGLGAAPLRMASVGSPDVIREILMQPNDRYRWGTPLSPFPFVVGQRTLLASDGELRRDRRGAVQYAFSRATATMPPPPIGLVVSQPQGGAPMVVRPRAPAR